MTGTVPGAGVVGGTGEGAAVASGALSKLGIIGATLSLTGSSHENPDDFVDVYRGTKLQAEIDIHSETGLIMSNAAQDKYMEITTIRLHENGKLTSRDYAEAAGLAGVQALKRHAELVKIYGSEKNLARAQTLDGDKFEPKPRSMFSLIKNIDRVRYFAQGGAVFHARINNYKLLKTPVRSSTEEEYFYRGQTRMERI